MSGIAGVTKPNEEQQVNEMLDALSHRGDAGRTIVSQKGITLGLNWLDFQDDFSQTLVKKGVALDTGPDGRLASATVTKAGKLRLERDLVGIAPLYWGATPDGAYCFASEVKGMITKAEEIHEILPEILPGQIWQNGNEIQRELITPKSILKGSSTKIAGELRKRLDESVSECAKDDGFGAWLSGGLDSSTMVALARQYTDHMHTFAAGVEGAPDLKYARIVAESIETEHHETIVTIQDILQALPEVIYHLESFDALLVRSSLTNYLVSKTAADFVPVVFSGEGGDELFGGYHYLKDLPISEIPEELVDITNRLHNTALQRVDRSSAANSLAARVGFLNPRVVEYALQIPPKYKIHKGVEKWILREAVKDLLPKNVLDRPKAKFWQGAGIKEMLAEHANVSIDDATFNKERRLSNGWTLNSKEELMYYRTFNDVFGTMKDLTWMGRTKGAPVH
jgi:asparagine synthase (glutamine-hydrolysing)